MGTPLKIFVYFDLYRKCNESVLCVLCCYFFYRKGRKVRFQAHFTGLAGKKFTETVTSVRESTNDSLAYATGSVNFLSAGAVSMCAPLLCVPCAAVE